MATQPVAPYREDPALAAQREAFRESQLSQPVACPVLLGHPTFDPAPDALAARREKVGVIRARLNSLALLILAENAALQPLISELDAEAEAVLTGELFNPAIARSFLGSLSQTVQALSATADKKSA